MPSQLDLALVDLKPVFCIFKKTAATEQGLYRKPQRFVFVSAAYPCQHIDGKT